MIDVPVEVKDALREGRLKKNYRMVVLNADGTEYFTIDNDTLVSESVSIDERMCSGDTIKFGLCEGSALEFQYFNHENITDRQVQVFCDVEYGEENPYSIPMGFFTVKKCSRQASTGIIKVTAYNKLQSDYLDAKANTEIQTMFSDPTTPVHLIDIEQILLNGYGIKEEERERIPTSAVRQVATSLPITTTIKAAVQYGIENPFNYYGMGNRTQYLWINEEIPCYHLDPNTPYRISFAKDFEIYERRVYEQMYQIFDEARLNKTAEDIMSTFMVSHTAYGLTYKGFQNVIGVMLTKADDSEEYYSTIGYENGCDGVVGTWQDLSQKVIYGYKEITLYLPYSVVATPQPDDSGQFEAVLMLWGVSGYGFHYYTDSSLQHEAVSYYPLPIKYSDETIIQYYDLVNANYFYVDKITNLSNAELVEITPSDLPDVTLRELQTASFETVCQFGQLDRITDLFSGVELNHSRLLPQDTLYPSDSLYPYGSGESAFRSQYSKLWADEGNIHKWKYLIITYKGLDGEGNETDYTLQRTVNNDGTDNYNCSDNWLFRNLVWTAEQIGTYADAMAAKMRDITWFPFEMWCAGLPYLETGDEIEIPLGNQTYTSYILQRQLKGIQNLQDTYINGTLDIF